MTLGKKTLQEPAAARCLVLAVQPQARPFAVASDVVVAPHRRLIPPAALDALRSRFKDERPVEPGAPCAQRDRLRVLEQPQRAGICGRTLVCAAGTARLAWHSPSRGRLRAMLRYEAEAAHCALAEARPQPIEQERGARCRLARLAESRHARARALERRRSRGA